jgi:hypothetical protein
MWTGDIIILSVCSKSVTLNNIFNSSPERWSRKVFTSHAHFLLAKTPKRTQQTVQIYRGGGVILRHFWFVVKVPCFEQ